MRRLLLLSFTTLSFSTVFYGQGTAKTTPTPTIKPPIYITPDNVTTIAQVTDVTSKDEYYIHLKALIESHKVKFLTNQYKYNGSIKLTSADLSYISSNGQVAAMAIANGRGIRPEVYKAQFGKSCATPSETNGTLTEAVVLDHLKCRFALTEMKNSTPNNTVTKGRFAMLMNQALNLWIRKIDALK